jgi:hypothetical protein
MAAYSLTATNISQQSPKLKKGTVRVYSSVDIYWVVGENPTATADRCALLPAGDTIELRLPVRCSCIAVLAVRDVGAVTIVEHNGGARSSCSL